MQALPSRQLIFCTQCGAGMERMQTVPVLQSLAGHTIHQCAGCGHVLLMQDEKAPQGNTGWLYAVPAEFRCGITCASLFGMDGGEEVEAGAG